MKTPLTTQWHLKPLAHQVFCTINGFQVEVCRDRKSLDTAFHLRYRAYCAAGAIPANKEEMLYDDYDFLPHAFTYLVWYKRRPVATIRGCIFSDQYDWHSIEGKHYFAKDIKTMLGEDTRLLESSRFAVDPDFQGRQSLFAQMLLFRAHGMNAMAHECPYIITLVRVKHIPFYRRFLQMKEISSEVKYVPWADAETALLAVPVDQKSQDFVRRQGIPDFSEEDIGAYAACAGIDIE